MTTLIHIENGPSKWDLMLALFDRSEKMREVEFVVHAGRYRVNVHGVEAEDGSGESWNIRGHAAWKTAVKSSHTMWEPVWIYFRTDSRTGSLHKD